MRGPKTGRKLRASQNPYPPQNEATTGTTSLPAPVGGWNARDPLAAMAATDAIVLDNIFPGTAEVSLRPGRQTFASGMIGEAQSLLPYHSTTGAKLFCGTTYGIYDVTAGGALANPLTFATSGKWESLNLVNSGGSFLVCVNGKDEMKLYDGATFKTLNAASTPAVTGLPTSKFTNISLFKRRIWLVAEDSMTVYYLDVDAIAGVAHPFPVGPIFPLGGKIVAQANWTIDSGTGPDDYLVTVTSEGEIAVYAGTDPSSADTFGLVGVYFAGKPVGKKCFLKYSGGDLIYLGQEGIYPISSLLQSTAVERTGKAVSDKIDNAIREAVASFQNNFGWELSLYSNEKALIVNVPILQGSLNYQFVMNTITKSWCRFTGWTANAFMMYENRLYSCSGSKVHLCWEGLSDDGVPISATVQQAYTNFRMGFQKDIPLTRPNISVKGSATITLSLDNDFQAYYGESQVSFIPLTEIGIWNESLWSNAVWNGSALNFKRTWLTVPNRPGFFHSFRLQCVTSNATFSWVSTEFAIRQAGIL